MWTRIQLDEERLHDAFGGLDPAGKGFITAKGIKKVAGVDFDDEEVDHMIAEADASGEGRIDYTEFARLWKNYALQKHHKPVVGRLQQVVRRFGGISNKLR